MHQSHILCTQRKPGERSTHVIHICIRAYTCNLYMCYIPQHRCVCGMHTVLVKVCCHQTQRVQSVDLLFVLAVEYAYLPYTLYNNIIRVNFLLGVDYFPWILQNHFSICLICQGKDISFACFCDLMLLALRSADGKSVALCLAPHNSRGS